MRTRAVAVAAALLVGAGLLFWLRAGTAPAAPSRTPAAPAAGTGGDGEGSSWEQGVAPAGDDAAAASGDASESGGEGADSAAGAIADPDAVGEDERAEDDEDQPPEHLRDEVEALRQAMEHRAMLLMQEVVLAEQARQTERYIADANDDGELDVLDLAVFLQWLEAGDMQADFSGDGALDHMDTVAFQTHLVEQTRGASPEQLTQLAIARALVKHQEMVVFEMQSETQERVRHFIELEMAPRGEGPGR